MPLVLVERDDPVAVVLLNRPAQLNALSDELMDELVTALRELDADEAVRCIVLGGSERAFAAGADIGELASSSAIDRAFEGSLSLGLDYERRAINLAFASEDAKEGLTAFLEKRKPEFQGR